jgi:hypothetical protein
MLNGLHDAEGVLDPVLDALLAAHLAAAGMAMRMSRKLLLEGHRQLTERHGFQGRPQKEQEPAELMHPTGSRPAVERRGRR